MELYLVKPDLHYYEAYNDMMAEWAASGTRMAPWFLDGPVASLEEFAAFVRMLDDCEHGRTDPRFSATSSYFAVDGAGELVGCASLRHYLTEEGLNSWGHVGYGVRPSRRRQGCATRILELTLHEARDRHILRVLLGAHESNTGSIKVIEACGGVWEKTVTLPDDPEPIRQYWIDNKDRAGYISR